MEADPTLREKEETEEIKLTAEVEIVLEKSICSLCSTLRLQRGSVAANVIC